MDLGVIVNRTLEAIHSQLQMDRSIVFWADDTEHTFYPRWALGTSQALGQAESNAKLNLRDLAKAEPQLLLHNKVTNPTPLSDIIQNQFRFTYFLCLPIKEGQNVIGWLLSGRDKEAWPFYPRLDQGDIDTFTSICGFLAASYQNLRLYNDLEDANEQLEEHNRTLEQKVQERTRDLVEEKKKSDDLLLNILPTETAEELKATGRSKARLFEQVSVLFTDFKGFTHLGAILSPERLVEEIDHCFRGFDDIIDRYEIEKIKTIGDAYLCVGGLPVKNTTNPIDVVNAALDIRNFMLAMLEERLPKGEPCFEIRIGVHTGPVVAGIVGVKKFAYDIWGDTVNTASRMESSGEVGKVNISGDTYALVKDQFDCVHRGKIPAKNKGEIDMYFVNGATR